jgi:hypothetical protein
VDLKKALDKVSEMEQKTAALEKQLSERDVVIEHTQKRCVGVNVCECVCVCVQNKLEERIGIL